MIKESEKEALRSAVELLAEYNLWRRDNDSIYTMPNPTLLGLAIDRVVEYMKEQLAP